MKLQLPPERPLPHPERMVEAILTEVPVRKASRRPARIYWISGLVAAAVAITAAAIGITAMQPTSRVQVGNPPTITAPTVPGSAAPSTASTPSASGTPSATPTASPTSSPRRTPTTSPTKTATPRQAVVNPIGTSARFANVVVSVTQTKWTEGQGLLVEAQVCVIKLPPNATGGTIRTGWDAWTVTTAGGTVQAELLPAAAQPTDSFPTDGRYQVHECATGWIPFGRVAGADAFTKINYADRLGNRASWLPTVRMVPIGQRVQVPYLDLTASGTTAGGDVYAILVETCVRSLPPGTPSGGMLLTRIPWTLSTSAGTVRSTDPIHSPIPLPSTYPQSVRLQVGECATGWIPFGVGHDTAVFAINYHNIFNGHVVWDPTT
jgi:hypothetical protein